MNQEKRSTKKSKIKENRKFPYKSGRPIKQSSTGNEGLYTCRYCNEKVDFEHVCNKKNKLWKNPQSQRSKSLKLLIKQNKISK